MQLQRTKSRRRGGALVESILTTTAVVMLLLGTVDLGMAIFYQTILSEAARQGARAAMVHGTSADRLGTWGPSTYGGSTTYCNDSDIKAQTVAAYLTPLDTSTVTVMYEWPDSSNAAEKRVRVTLTTTWTPILGFIFGTNTQTISASSMMPIAH